MFLFNITDGICCSYTNGAYSVTYDGNVVKTGGAFGGLESTSFGACVTEPPSSSPTVKPSLSPTASPSKGPTDSPSESVAPSTNSPTSLSPTSSPQQMPTPSPLNYVLPPSTVSPTTSSIPTSNPTGSPTSSPEQQCMDFQTKDAASLVRNVLRDPNGYSEFRNIQASGHECYNYFYNGNVMGHNLVTGEQLIPNEGIIMSSGAPEEFCWNDSDQNSKNWYGDGDADLTAVVQQSSRYSNTYDACVIEFEFRCVQEQLDLVASQEVSFRYVWGSDEYYEYVNSGT